MNVSLEGDWKIFSTPSLSNFDRWSVGYSNLFDTLRAIPEKSPATYPPHNIIKKSDNEFSIELALAGFKKEDVEVVLKEDRLTVSGDNSSKENEKETVLYKGVASRSFNKTFYLAETIEVSDAVFKDGMVIINLKQNIPENKNPKVIPLK